MLAVQLFSAHRSRPTKSDAGTARSTSKIAGRVGKMASAPAQASRRVQLPQNYSIDSKVDSYWRDFRKRRLVTNNYFAYHRAGRTIALAGIAPWDKVNEQPSLRLVDEAPKPLPQNWDEIYADLNILALQNLRRRNRLRVGQEKGPPSLRPQLTNRQ